MADVSQREIVPLQRAHYDRADQALARAFADYNLMVYALPDAVHRAPAVARLYGAFLADAYRYGEVFVTNDGIGACCWLPPGKTEITLPRQLRAGLIRLPFLFGWNSFRNLLAYDAVAQEMHHAFASGPHWYLSAIGVEPEYQGQGIGGLLMQPILQRADAGRLPCYLETHVEANVRMYQKHGFRVARQAAVAGHPIPVWSMVRPAREN